MTVTLNERSASVLSGINVAFHIKIKPALKTEGIKGTHIAHHLSCQSCKISFSSNEKRQSYTVCVLVKIDMCSLMQDHVITLRVCDVN